MKLKQLGRNMTEIRTDNSDVLFSYETPVAGWDDVGPFRTDQFFSNTTSRHINKYFADVDPSKIRISKQDHIEDMMLENVGDC
jgi:hypothetical protein